MGNLFPFLKFWQWTMTKAQKKKAKEQQEQQQQQEQQTKRKKKEDEDKAKEIEDPDGQKLVGEEVDAMKEAERVAHLLVDNKTVWEKLPIEAHVAASEVFVRVNKIELAERELIAASEKQSKTKKGGEGETAEQMKMRIIVESKTKTVEKAMIEASEMIKKNSKSVEHVTAICEALMTITPKSMKKSKKRMEWISAITEAVPNEEEIAKQQEQETPMKILKSMERANRFMIELTKMVTMMKKVEEGEGKVGGGEETEGMTKEEEEEKERMRKKCGKAFPKSKEFKTEKEIEKEVEEAKAEEEAAQASKPAAPSTVTSSSHDDVL